MTKRTIFKTWLAGVILIVAGGVVSGISAGLWLAQSMDPAKPGQLPVIPGGSFWTSMTFFWLGGSIAVGGFALKFVARVGALLNSSRLAQKTWYHMLLWGGIIAIITGPLLGLGELICSSVTVAYLIEPSDGVPAVRQPHPVWLEPIPATLIMTN